MRKLFTIIALFATATITMAQTISETAARGKASQFFRKNMSRAKGTQSQSPVLAYTSKSGDATCFYIYNNGNDGFVIVGGDEAAREILGYSEGGAFSYEAAPENLKWWLSQYTGEISNAIAEVKSGKAALANNLLTNAGSQDVAPLVTAQWNQGSPYNDQIQKMTWADDGYKDLATGCVATAASQVMYKWRHPATGTGSNSYTLKYKQNSSNTHLWDCNNTEGTQSLTFSADFSQSTYDWNNMTDTYGDGSTDAQKTAVAKLMSDVGIAINMSYGQLQNGGSGAAQEDLGNALVTNFGYSKNINNRYRANYTDADWESLVYAELAAGRPVIYGAQGTKDGTTSTGGHQFVIDGYRSSDNMFHVNWGWGGSYNNYFLLTATGTQKALTPDGTGAGGAAEGSSYILDQTFLQNVKPEDGDAQRCYMTTNGFGLTKDGSTTSTSLSVTAGTLLAMRGFDNVQNTGFIYNSGSTTINTEVGIRLKNADKTIDMSCGERQLDPGSGESLQFKPLTAGEYSVIPIYKNAGEWVEAKATTANPYPTLTVTGSATGLSIVGSYGFENGACTTTDMKYKVTIKNSGDACDKWIILCIAPGNTAIGYLYPATEEGYTHFDAGEEKEIILSIYNAWSDHLTVGNTYYAWVYNWTDGKNLTNPSAFTLKASTSIDYTMTDAGWGTVCLPFCADVPDGLKAYSVSAISGNTLVLQDAAEIKMNTPYVLKGTPGSYSFSGPEGMPTGTYAAGKLIGTTAADTKTPKGAYVLQNKDNTIAFYKVENANSQKFTQYRACIYEPDTQLTAILLPGTTGISQLEHVELTTGNAPAYNLSGQRVSPDTKGIVIINGKKIFNK